MITATPIPGQRTSATQLGDDISISFQYAEHDATYLIQHATVSQFDQVLKILRDGLANPGKKAKIHAVVDAFFHAIKMWPHANPSDIWWFVVYRAFCDPYNHPAKSARKNLDQSWKRTSGAALEEIVVRHYGSFLESNGLRIFSANRVVKNRFLREAAIGERLEASKIDILVTTLQNEFLGVLHVKASLAERRTDDVPMSKALIRAGYVSPLWTMDCKGTPSEKPVNRGELGKCLGQEDRRSAKRKDVEEDECFSACFSYNSNTLPTPKGQNAKAKIHVCSFNSPDDGFSRFMIAQSRK